MTKPNSALRRYVLGDKGEWHYQEHLLADIRDALSFIAYFTPYAALANFDKNDKRAISRDVPKAPLRPGDEPEQIAFAKKDELTGLFGAGKPRGRNK